VSTFARYIVDCKTIIHAGYYVIYISSHPHSCQESPRGVKENLWILALRRWYEYAGGIQRRKSTVKPYGQESPFAVLALYHRRWRRQKRCAHQKELTLAVFPAALRSWIISANSSRRKIMN